MPAFGPTSMERLATCDPRLQRLFAEVVKHWDCTVLCGHRGQVEQEAAFAAGKSKARWGQSKHNSMPSRAVDVMPWPVNWDDIPALTMFAGFVLATAAQMGIRVRWGADWDQDRKPWEKENWEQDGPHWELLED